MSQSEFEKYLKNSDHFVGTINAHRTATAEVIAAFATLLMENNHVSKEAVRELLERMEAPTSSGPSIDGSRRVLAARIGDKLNIRGR
jgi:hypothetical protein